MEQTAQIKVLKRQVRQMQVMLSTVILVVGAMALMSAQKSQEILEVVKARKIIVVDEEGVARVVIGQDPKDTQRRSRAAGITIHDGTGSERGGLGTFDDGSVIFALDAPVGVGSPMRDRLGMGVWPDGSSHIMLIDNNTKGVAKLISDGNGNGGFQVFQWDDSAKVVRTKTMNFAGETVDEQKYGDW